MRVHGMPKKLTSLHFLSAMLVPVMALAQSGTQRQYHRPAPKIPKQCDDTRGNPWLAAMCNHFSRGRPQASSVRLRLPIHGSAEAKRVGFACVNGLAMERLKNGWSQLRDEQANFYRCDPL